MPRAKSTTQHNKWRPVIHQRNNSWQAGRQYQEVYTAESGFGLNYWIFGAITLGCMRPFCA